MHTVLLTDRFSDVDLLAAQNTILYHLNNCSEYKISEKEVVQQFKVRETYLLKNELL